MTTKLRQKNKYFTYKRRRRRKERLWGWQWRGPPWWWDMAKHPWYPGLFWPAYWCSCSWCPPVFWWLWCQAPPPHLFPCEMGLTSYFLVCNWLVPKKFLVCCYYYSTKLREFTPYLWSPTNRVWTNLSGVKRLTLILNI